MNILFLTNHLNIGGITSYLLTIIKGLKLRRHSVYIAANFGEGAISFTEQGAIFIPIPINTKCEVNLLKLGRSFWILRRFIRQYNIEVIHSNTRVTQVLGYLLSKRFKVAHVSTWHGFFKNRLGRRLFPCWPDAVIAVSEAVKKHLIKEMSASEDRVYLIYNAIDMERIRLKENVSQCKAKKQLGLMEGPVIGIIGRLSEVKGHIYLLEAFGQIQKEFPEAQLLIVGEGRIRPLLEQKVETLGLSTRVKFLGNIRDIWKVFYCIDVFVMPSLKEGLGLSLMEAMAWAKPVIGSDVGGIRNLIKNKENGLLVQPQNSQALAEALQYILTHPVEAAIMGRNAQKFITDNFSTDKMVEETEKVYRLCLEKKRNFSF
ncbi:MAG: glycosyltransferase family 4 protein [Candidatus Omnitrophica bacterium]|nr:glycosyltransferase family 4 protein [Candidatus Omnitrophota bacterium]